MHIDQDRYKNALDFAARVHRNQTVPGSGAPYVVHVVKVAMEVMAATEQDQALDRDLAITCALLHDTVEDALVEDREKVRSDLESSYGASVLRGVEALSKDKSIDKIQQMADSLRRIRGCAREVWLVKLADRITNMEPPPPDWSLEKRRHYREEAETILEALSGASPILEARFKAKLAEYAKYCA